MLPGLRARLALLFVGLLLMACGGAASPTTTATTPRGLLASPTVQADAARVEGDLTVFAAASLTDAFKEMAAAIEAAHPGTTVTLNFAGSQTLRTQLAQGARADVFASADELTMQGAREDGSIAGEPRIFAHNKLVVIVPAGNPAGINALQDLAQPGVKLVLAQEAVPAGNYAHQVLAKLSQDGGISQGFQEQVRANVVSREPNVKQVVTKVQLGEADAGIVYSSDVTPEVRPKLATIAIPDQFNSTARYPIAVVKGTDSQAAATAFIDYVLSPAGQAILEKHGFIPVQRATSGG